MTLRQKEFCRAYAKGLAAPKAAIAAGYAKSTAERNAAHFLSHPAIAAEIARLRLRKSVISYDDLERAKRKLMHTIDYAGDALIQIRAVEALCRLARTQQKLEIGFEGETRDTLHKHEMEAALLFDAVEDMAEADPEKDPDFFHETVAQLTDIEGNTRSQKECEEPKEFDRQEDGTLAFDRSAAGRDRPAGRPAHRKDTIPQSDSAKPQNQRPAGFPAHGLRPWETDRPEPALEPTPAPISKPIAPLWETIPIAA